MVAIETSCLTKYYAAHKVVDNVSLSVPEGCVYGFVGPNGAGKTTVMRMLLGLVRPDSGHARLFGHDIASDRRSALAQVGAVIEGPSLYGHLSGHANLDLTRTLLGLPRTEPDRVLDLVDLRAAASQKVGTYSLGMKQRLAIARTLLGSPRLLLLDEPTNGLDPDGIIAMRSFIRDLPDRMGGTVFVSSHLLTEVQQVADHVGLMQAGRLVVQDRVTSLIGANSNYAIEVGDAARGTALLQAAGLDAENVMETVMLFCPNGDDARIQASRANRLLIEAGFDVSALTPQPVSLEDIYRAATMRQPNIERIAA